MCHRHNYLRSDIVKNEIVNDNEGCMDLVKDSMKITDSKSSDVYSVTPRKSPETPVIVFLAQSGGQRNLCYFPREDLWRKAPAKLRSSGFNAISCGDKLYLILQMQPFVWRYNCVVRYDSFANCMTNLPYEE